MTSTILRRQSGVFLDKIVDSGCSPDFLDSILTRMHLQEALEVKGYQTSAFVCSPREHKSSIQSKLAHQSKSLPAAGLSLRFPVQGAQPKLAVLL